MDSIFYKWLSFGPLWSEMISNGSSVPQHVICTPNLNHWTCGLDKKAFFPFLEKLPFHNKQSFTDTFCSHSHQFALSGHKMAPYITDWGQLTRHEDLNVWLGEWWARWPHNRVPRGADEDPPYQPVSSRQRVGSCCDSKCVGGVASVVYQRWR